MRAYVEHSHVHDGETFRIRGWPSPVPTRTAIVVHHGLGEHGGRYSTLAQRLETLPAHIWTYDLRGHGDTTGRRGDAAGLEGLASDLEALLPVLLGHAGADRLVLYGHSMGGAAVGWYLTTRAPHPALTTLMISAPPVYVVPDLGQRIKVAAGRMLSGVAPRLTLGSGLPATGISSDPSEVERYRADPLVHDRISVRFALSLLDDAPTIPDRADRIRVPTLMWHGLDDPIVDVRGTRRLFAALGAEDKTLFELPGYRHEAHHERPELAAHLLERVRAWLEPRIAEPAARSAAP